MPAVHTEVWVVAGYAVFLVLVARGLELLGRHSHRRSARYRTAGFRYHPGLDVWECPEGEHLVRGEIDFARGVVRYRAPARACNACARKPMCTDSDQGREIAHAPEGWVRSEMARFHRGLSLALLFLAAVILAVEMARWAFTPDRVVLGSLLAPVSIAGTRLFSAFLAGAPGADDGFTRH